jgi:phosphohistidine phosphatase SixA
MTAKSHTRRLALLIVAGMAVAPIAPIAPAAQADEAGWAALRQPGAVALIRHARAPGTGDPPGFRPGDCATQRNLSEEGRAQARRLGEALRTRGIVVGRVLSSEWCRARDTAMLAFGAAEAFPALNSFFADRTDEPEQSDAARAAIGAWRGDGVLMMVTHQVNITALTGISPREGEIVVVRGRDGRVVVEGRIFVGA